jgi:hypothetical protein
MIAQAQRMAFAMKDFRFIATSKVAQNMPPLKQCLVDEFPSVSSVAVSGHIGWKWQSQTYGTAVA